jgi:hypothetical protein
MKKNTLSSELALAKELGFKATSKNSKARNPYMLLNDGTCLVWVAGCLLGRVTTEVHFGQRLHLVRWKSSNGNKPEATLTATEIDSNGLGVHTVIYYREAYRSSIDSIARSFNMLPTEVVLDHINHMRGDCRRENLRPATKAQNNQNRSKVRIEKAFYTVDDLREKLASGEWTPLEY